MAQDDIKAIHAELIHLFTADRPDLRSAIEAHLREDPAARKQPELLHIFQRTCVPSPVPGKAVASELELSASTFSRRIRRLSEIVHEVLRRHEFPLAFTILAQVPGGGKNVIFCCEGHPLGTVQRALLQFRQRSPHGSPVDQSSGPTHIVLDGLVCMRVAELLSDDPSARPEGPEAAPLYRKALADFAVAGMLFDYLGAGKWMWPVGQGGGDDRPITEILTEVYFYAGFREKVVEIDTAADLNIVARSHHRAHILDYVSNLGNAGLTDWLAHVNRDTLLHLGSDKSLYDPSLDYSEYVFNKPYIDYDEDLWKALDPGLLHACTKVVRDRRSDVVPRACEIFVYKVLVAHVVAGFSYMVASDIVRPPSGFRDYLPSEARAKVMVSSRPSRPGDVTLALSRVYRLLVPYCLYKVCAACENRHNFVATMYELVDSDDTIAETRKGLRGIRAEIENGNNRAVDTLAEDLRAVASRRDTPIVADFKHFNAITRSGMWAQQLAESTPPELRQPVESKLAKLFPDIFGG